MLVLEQDSQGSQFKLGVEIEDTPEELPSCCLVQRRELLLQHLRVHQGRLHTLVGNEVPFLLDLLVLDYAVDLHVPVALGFLADGGRQRSQELRSGLNEHLSSSLGVQGSQEGNILALQVQRFRRVVAWVLTTVQVDALLRHESHQLLLLQIFGQGVKKVFIQTDIPQKGL